MEQVINVRLRSQAFWKFIILFLITVLIIVFAVYFDFQIPWKDNQLLRSKEKVMEDNAFTQAEFITLVETTKRNIDSIGKTDINNVFFNIQLLDDKVKELTDAKFKDNGAFSETNKTMFSLFYDYKELKKQMFQLQKDDAHIKELEAALTQCKSDYEQAQRNLDFFRRSDNYVPPGN